MFIKCSVVLCVLCKVYYDIRYYAKFSIYHSMIVARPVVSHPSISIILSIQASTIARQMCNNVIDTPFAVGVWVWVGLLRFKWDSMSVCPHINTRVKEIHSESTTYVIPFSPFKWNPINNQHSPANAKYR